MQHRIVLAVILLIVALGLSACASTNKSTENASDYVPSPISLALEADMPNVWQNAASQLKSRVPEFDIQVTSRSEERRYLDTIFKSEDGKWGVCVAPKPEFDFAGSLIGFTPLYCGELDANHPDLSLQNAVASYQANRVEQNADESVVEFRQRILRESTPENPVCFSVFPALFSTGDKISEILMENYLIACSRRIDGHTSDFLPDGILSSWILAQAALITEKNSLISKAFRQIVNYRSRETSVYGISLEAYTEFLSRKQIQAEISSARAIVASDEAGYYLTSHENAQLLALLAKSSETMDGARLEMTARSLAPREGMPARIAEERQMLLLKVCDMADFVPDVTAETVSACLPWLRLSIKNKDSFETALLLIEHGVYGSKDGPAIAEDVLSWLQNAPLSDELKSLRHEFGVRLLSNDKLSEKTLDVLRSF